MAAPVLLGVCDQAVQNPDEVTPFTNKIGGSPNLYGPSLDIPVCPLCGRPMLLVVQLYCPLGGSPYHRTLYVFSCCAKTCWNKQDSWAVIRCQQLVKDNQTSSSSGKQSVEEWCDFADDWGERNQDSTGSTTVEDWGVGQDDWGVGEDSWGTESSMSEKKDTLTPSSREQDKPSGSSGLSEIRTLETQNQKLSHESGADVEAGVLDLSQFKQMNIDDADDSENEGSVLAHCQADDAAMERCDTSTLGSILQRGSSPETETVEQTTGSSPGSFKSFFLSAFDEPAGGVESDRHIQKLMKEYSQREGVNFKRMLEDFDGCTGEKYERTQVQHGDNTFHKFMKRVALCPEQCLRYTWCGKPLLMSQPPGNLTPMKCTCGAERVFEMQLMPALVNILKLEGHNEGPPPLEFGTVLIYSCLQSCWKEGDTSKEESVIVQADPDQHLFK